MANSMKREEWKNLWDGLSEEQKEWMRAKANYEQLSLLGVWFGYKDFILTNNFSLS